MRSMSRIAAICALVFLFLGCHHPGGPVRVRIDQNASERYVMGDAVPVLEYEGNGKVKYITRHGESGEINLKEHTILKDSSHQYRQYGMPYQLIDSIRLVSSSDKGIQVEGCSLEIPDKGSHYSAYKCMPVNTERDILSVTSDGIFLFRKDRDGKYVSRRLYPDSATKENSIDVVRFVDLCCVDDRTYYAAGPPGVVKIVFDGSWEPFVEKVQFFNRSRIKVTHIRTESGSGALVAYAQNGKVYRKEPGAVWVEKERNAERGETTLSFSENVDGVSREWRFGFDVHEMYTRARARTLSMPKIYSGGVGEFTILEAPLQKELHVGHQYRFRVRMLKDRDLILTRNGTWYSSAKGQWEDEGDGVYSFICVPEYVGEVRLNLWDKGSDGMADTVIIYTVPEPTEEEKRLLSELKQDAAAVKSLQAVQWTPPSSG